MPPGLAACARCTVALRKESVDRNVCFAGLRFSYFRWSLSARRAWIEIVDPDKDSLTDDVALRKESVDRNVGLSCLNSVSC